MTPEQQNANTLETLFANPYKGIEHTPLWKRINYDVDKQEHHVVKTILADNGALPCAVNLFIHHLYEYILTNKLNAFIPADRLKLIEHILNLTGVQGQPARLPSAEPHGERPGGNVGLGTGCVHSDVQSAPHQPEALQGKQTEEKVEVGGRGKRPSKRPVERAEGEKEKAA